KQKPRCHFPIAHHRSNSRFTRARWVRTLLTFASCTPPPANLPTIRDSCRQRPVTRRSPISTAIRASCCIAVIRSNSWQLIAMSYKYSIGQPFVYPRNDLSYSANFMRMMFSNPCEEYKVNDVLVRALDRILILHADHEQNASTSTVRLAGSSGANPFACIAAG